MWTLKGKGNCYKCNTQGKNKHFANTGNNAYSESLSQKQYMHHSNHLCAFFKSVAASK